MGKQTGPSPEELEFIFECFTRGLSDREILDEMQNTEFPLRNPRFVRDRRREFNAARKVLETTLKQQADPVLVKLKEGHFAEIHDLLEMLVQVTRTPHVFEIELEQSNRPLDLIPLEANKLFGSLQQHLPSSEIWSNYSMWKEKYRLYIDSCNNFIRQFINDDVVKDFMKQEGKSGDKWFYRPPLRFLSEIALGKEPNVFSGSLPDIPEDLLKLEIEKRRATEAKGYTYYIIDDREIENYKPEICDSFLHTEAANNVVALFRETKALEKQFRVPLEEALVSRSYSETRCRLCPGQGK